MFRQRWWIAVITFVIRTGVSIYYALTAPNVYRAMLQAGHRAAISFSSRATDLAGHDRRDEGLRGQPQLQYMMGNHRPGQGRESTCGLPLPDGSGPNKSSV